MPDASADLIREARARAGLTQRQLASRAGTSQAVISAYENTRREPGLAQLAKVLGAAGFDLVTRLEPKARPRGRRGEAPWRLADDGEDDDRILENLRLTPTQRLRKMGAMRGFAAKYRGAVARRP